MNKNWLKYLVALSAIMIAGSAAYFSVTGLGVLFSGAAVAVMVMAGSLEFAKLVTATYLKQEWDNVSGVNKWYLTSAVVILMAITSAGIFGYLSNAFQQQNLKLEQIQREIDVWNNKIQTDTAQITLYTNQLNQLQSNNNTVLNANTNKSGLKFATSTSKEQSKIRTKISALNDSVVVYNGKINDIKNANIGVEREVGGFRFVAESFGVPLNSVVRFFIILIVIVFDPLAVALVISFNQLVLTTKRKEEEEPTSVFQDELKDFVEGYDPITYAVEEDVKSDKEDLKNFVDETVRLRLSEEDLKKIEEILLNPPPPNDALKKAAEEYNETVQQPTQERREELLAEMVKNNQELGLYDEDWGGLNNEELIGDDEIPSLTNESIYDENDELTTYGETVQEEIDEQNYEKWLLEQEWLSEQEGKFSTIEPTEEEERGNFSTIEPNSENIFHYTENEYEEPVTSEEEILMDESEITEKLNEVQSETFSETPTSLNEDDEKKK